MSDLIFSIYTLNKMIQNEIQPHLKKWNISYSEGQILLFLVDKNSLSQDYITTRLNMKKSLVSQLVSELNEKKLIEITLDENDKRYKMISLTTYGISVANEFEEMISKFNETLLSNLSQYNKVNIDLLLREITFGIKRKYK